LAVILAFIFQGGAIIWYASSETTKVEAIQQRSIAQENLLTGPQGLSERMTRVEEKQSAAQKSLDRIETIFGNDAGSDWKEKMKRLIHRNCHYILL
jgi:hypothetical protein